MNTFPQRAGFSVPASEGKSKSKRLTLSLVHLEALSERQRGVTGLTTASCGAEGCKVLCLVDDFDEPVSKRLQGKKRVVRANLTPRTPETRAFVSSSDISLAGTSSRLEKKKVDCVQQIQSRDWELY
jgi:hypothetical protein